MIEPNHDYICDSYSTSYLSGTTKIEFLNDTFNKPSIIISTISTHKKVKFGSQTLGNVLNTSDINALALATRSECFENKSKIISEGDKGETFYMIECGTVHVVKSSHGKQPLVTLKKGNFFGEKSLFSNDTRTATCIADGKVKCLTLVRDDFVRLFGDLQELLDKSQKMVDESFKTANENIPTAENNSDPLEQ